MSKELDAAKAAFDADIANPANRLTEEEIRKVIRSVTDPDEQREFLLYMMKTSARRSTRNLTDDTDGVDLSAVTEFFESLADEPSGGKDITRERFDELASNLSGKDKLYCAKVLIQEQIRRDRAQNAPSPVNISNVPGIRVEAIREYTNKLGAILKTHTSPTRAEFEDMMSVLNDKEKEVVMGIQLRLNDGKPLPFRDDGPLH